MMAAMSKVRSITDIGLSFVRATRRINRRIEDCWIGDVLGGTFLIIAAIGGFLIAGILQ